MAARPKRRTPLPLLLAGAALALVTGRSLAADTVLLGSENEAGEYAQGGMDACLECHDETEARPVLSILATRHGVKADARTPIGSAHQCQACHGPSAAHLEEPAPGQPRAPVAVSFGPDAPIAPQNEACLACHEGGGRMNWAGSGHERQNLACASCHDAHVQEDPVLRKDIDPMIFARDGQAKVCFSCHMEQRAQVQQRVSSHPLREGKMECSSCHNPHGSIGPGLLKRPTLNETCYQCHAEKRGPFLWEHAPVREDCSLCHTPHGSNHPVLLRTRVPQLCQQCHMAAFHPSTAYTGPDFATPRLDIHSLEEGCMNCHSEVHGSNHPSGVRQIR
ncbi:MAG: DmsE family decaheme c-type cytochrome [Myxococcota bacterium]